MKSVKLSVFALAVVALGLGSCSKEAGVTPSSTESNGSDQRTFIDGSSIDFYDATNKTITFAAASDIITIKGAFPGKDCGKVQLKRRIMDNVLKVLVDDPNFVAPANYTLDATGTGGYSFTLDHNTCGNGIYYYSAHFVSSGKGCSFTPGFVPELPIEIKNTCAGFSLCASGASVIGNQVTFDITATNCTGRPVTYKLQGGLIAGATASSITATRLDPTSGLYVPYTSVDGYSISNKNQNSVLTWNTTLNDGKTFKARVSYTYTKTMSAGMNFTGTWTAKEASGNSLGDFKVIMAVPN